MNRFSEWGKKGARMREIRKQGWRLGRYGDPNEQSYEDIRQDAIKLGLDPERALQIAERGYQQGRREAARDEKKRRQARRNGSKRIR